MYGYQLRSEFEQRTGSTWPLNVGQVYTTLTRLERDGLVKGAGADGEGHVMYHVTPAGRAEVAAWFTTPVPRTQPPRDELADGGMDTKALAMLGVLSAIAGLLREIFTMEMTNAQSTRIADLVSSRPAPIRNRTSSSVRRAAHGMDVTAKRAGSSRTTRSYRRQRRRRIGCRRVYS